MGGHRELDVEAQLALLQNAVENLEESVQAIDDSIRGNGGKGIQTRLALHSQRLDQLAAFVDEVHALKRWMIMGVLSLVGSLVWQALQFLLNQGPTP